MIDPAIANGLGNIAARERDARGAYRSGFTPEVADVARTAQTTPSADPLSVAPPEGAYFLTPDPGGVVFSRDGVFGVVDGGLCAADGRPVLGFANGKRDKVVPLRIDPYDAALGRVSAARIETDGTFAYTRASIDPRTGERRTERVSVGRIALARFPAGTQPERLDGVRVRAPHGVTPRVGTAADGNFGSLATYARDLGRVDLMSALDKLGEAYISYEALRSAHHARGSLEKTALDLVK